MRLFKTEEHVQRAIILKFHQDELQLKGGRCVLRGEKYFYVLGRKVKWLSYPELASCSYVLWLAVKISIILAS